MDWREIKQNLRYGDTRMIAQLLDLPAATVYSTVQREAGKNVEEIRKALTALIATRRKAEREFNELIKQI